MEVHHHSYAHGKKNWKAYFWEFLMLFLAVFCGFLAENVREHKIEQNRAKEYATLLIGDLKNDTLSIMKTVKQLKEISQSIDSVCSFVYHGFSATKVNGSFYYHSRIATTGAYVIWNNATFIQLTQSGNLRYLRNHELVNKISNYYSLQEFERGIIGVERGRSEISEQLRSRILNNHYYKNYSEFLTLSTLPIPDSLLTKLILVQTTDNQLLNEFANSFENRKPAIRLLIKDIYPRAITRARDLILLLKKEYRLK